MFLNRVLYIVEEQFGFDKQGWYINISDALSLIGFPDL